MFNWGKNEEVKLEVNQDLMAKLRADTRALEMLANETKTHAEEVTNVLKSQLRDVTKKFHTLSEVVQDALIVINEKFEITDFSPVASVIFGWNKEDILGKSIKELMPSTHFMIFEKIIQEESDCQFSLVNGQGIKKNQQHIDIEFTISKMFSDNEQFYFIVVRDVTERLKYLAEIQAKSEILYAIAECSHLWFKSDWKETMDLALQHLGTAVNADAVSIYKFQNNCCEPRFTWSRTTENQLLENIDCDSLQIKDRVKTIEKGEVICISESNPGDREALQKIRCKSITLVPVIANGMPWGYFCYYFKHEDKRWFNPVMGTLYSLGTVFGAALESKGRKKDIQVLQRTINNLSDSVVIVNRTGEIIFTNRVFCELTGKDYSEIVGSNFWKEYSPISKKFEQCTDCQKGWCDEINFDLDGCLPKSCKVIPMVNGDKNRPSYYLIIQRRPA